ncbi:hypothetical protein V6N13_029538 [Hibiscus sabdariffa]|uniref:Uncharacterized protein n=1 Tax=Hibiscus sabdariffa TaxID=183260 RepID=A0ABR2TA36_9ROSI
MTYVLNNLMKFFTGSWNLKLKEAAAIVNLQGGLRNILQIFVAHCIDAYLGYRWMLILSSLLYSAGLFLLAFSVPKYSLNDDTCGPLKGSILKTKEVANYCFKKLKHTYFWEGLALLIVGAAAQVIPLYSLSFDQTRVLKPPQDPESTRAKFGCFKFPVHIGGLRQLKQKVIGWFCYGFLIPGAIVSFFGFISSEEKWHKRFLTPAIAMFIGLLWLFLQFIFLGLMEGLAGKGILDFFGHYAPNSRRYGPVFASTLKGLGTVINIGFIAILDYYSEHRYKQSWLGDSVNQSRLDSIYRAYTILALINCFVYAYVASSYSYDNIIGMLKLAQRPIMR